LTLADCERIFHYWDENPPTYLMVQIIARMLGWKGHNSSAVAPTTLGMVPGFGAAPPSDILAAFAELSRLRAPKKTD
jgi:hypothetical protein